MRLKNCNCDKNRAQLGLLSSNLLRNQVTFSSLIELSTGVSRNKPQVGGFFFRLTSDRPRARFGNISCPSVQNLRFGNKFNKISYKYCYFFNINLIIWIKFKKTRDKPQGVGFFFQLASIKKGGKNPTPLGFIPRNPCTKRLKIFPCGFNSFFVENMCSFVNVI